MLQTGLRDILSSIVGRIAALGHALAAHDIALGRSHGSRAWAAWKRTWGFGHHQHVMPSVFAPYAVSRAAPAPHARWPNECAIGHACRIVAIHAFGRCACGHDRRVVSEQEPTERTDGYDWHHLFLMLLYIVKRLGVLFWVGCRVYPLDGPLLEFGKVACAAFDLADAARGHAERLADLLLGDVPADA